ncbi:hypothetical protein AH4AK4_0932 [Aeromonas hydrophila 4AK4]|nr:hypothetical protein AH4AK4_0932 [Aeromonas hydrophila 4AK4]
MSDLRKLRSACADKGCLNGGHDCLAHVYQQKMKFVMRITKILSFCRRVVN